MHMKTQLSILSMLGVLASKVVDIDVEREGNIIIVYITCDDGECADRLVELISKAREVVSGTKNRFGDVSG